MNDAAGAWRPNLTPGGAQARAEHALAREGLLQPELPYAYWKGGAVWAQRWTRRAQHAVASEAAARASMRAHRSAMASTSSSVSVGRPS
jgi:hypothetical protein